MIEYITDKQITDYANFLRGEEKSGVTIEKYLRDLRRFRRYLGSRGLSKEETLGFKQRLIEKKYAVASVNSMLSSVNGFLRYCGRQDCCVKSLRVQRRVYVPEERELTKEEYRRLLEASKGDEQMNLLLQTICATGIRVSELRYFTVEAIAPTAKDPEPLCRPPEYPIRPYFCDQVRQLSGPQQCMGEDEAPVRCGQCGVPQGLPPQSAKALRQDLLYYGKGHRPIGRHSGPRQH